ncbi:MAG: energy transducer TonB [Alphaproteobacteria bacterium]
MDPARDSTIGARDGNAAGRRTGDLWVGGVTLFRLPLGLSFAGHAAALALIAWLASSPPSIPDQPQPATIPLIFVEPTPSSNHPAAAHQAIPAAPSAAAREPLETGEQNPPPSPAEQSPSPAQPIPAPPIAAVSEPAAAPHPSPPAKQASAPEAPTEEPVPLPREKPPPAPAPKSVAPSQDPEGPTAAGAPSRIKPAKPRDPARAAAPAPASRAARKPPAASDAGPPLARRDTPAAAAAPGGAPATEQIAAVPPPAAAVPRGAAVAPTQNSPPQISAEYRVALSTWLERHKIYPEAARRRGEQGSAILRFRVARNGSILTYQLVRSTGHAALDAAVDEMMRGATLPPFPASMTQPEIAVSVPIRFSLSG